MREVILKTYPLTLCLSSLLYIFVSQFSLNSLLQIGICGAFFIAICLILSFFLSLDHEERVLFHEKVLSKLYIFKNIYKYKVL